MAVQQNVQEAGSRGETGSTAAAYITIPDDIVLQIFPHLPTKAVLRFKCVCKAWSKALDDHHCDGKLVIIDQPPKYIYMINGDSTVSHLRRVHGILNVSSRLVPSPIVSGTYLLHSTCLGLLCYVSRGGLAGHTVRVWNPLRKEIYTIPEMASPSQYSVYGLGFDSTTNAYKIVHAFDTDKPDCNVDVYTLGTGVWRKIKEKPQFSLGVRMAVFAAHALHWDTMLPGRRVRSGDDAASYIVSFDLANEVFYTTRHPEAKKMHLVELKGRLAMVDQSSNDGTVNIWILDENKVDWYKAYTIEIKGFDSGENNVVMGMWNNDILLKNEVGGFFNYDTKSGKLERVDVPVRFHNNYRPFVSLKGNLAPLKFV